MSEKMARQINRQLADALAARKHPAFSSRKAVQDLLRMPHWTPALADLLPIRQRLTCAQVLELCAPAMDQLCPEAPERAGAPSATAISPT